MSHLPTNLTDLTGFEGKADLDGAAVLDDVRRYLQRFIAYPSGDCADAHTLWVAHAHAVDSFENTPRLAFLSPEPGSGKSRALEVTEVLVPNPVLSVNATVAYIFRRISDEAGLPVILMDEVDAIFSHAKADGNEDLRGLLNSGYRRGATAGRAAIRGKEVVTEDWPTFCPVALAGLNTLPDTLMTRSIVIPMKRRRHGQRVEPYRRRVNAPAGAELSRRLARFVQANRTRFTDAWPDLPEGIEDRDADIWEPLLAVADAAGGHWPDTARATAVAMVAAAKVKPPTLGIQLLQDIRALMQDTDRIGTTDLLAALNEMDDAPWGNLRGEPINARYLAQTLGKYDIPTNNTVWIANRSVKGYVRAHFADAWGRYLPELIPHQLTSRGGEEGNAILNKQGSILNSRHARVSPKVGGVGKAGEGTGL